MAIVCIAGVAPGIGKTALAEFLLAHLPGWHAARVRVGDEIPETEAALLSDAAYRLSGPAAERAADAEVQRLAAAGARSVTALAAEPRGLAAGLKALLGRLPPRADLLVEGNAFLWAREADVAVMVIGPGPAGRGLVRVRPAVRELFRKVGIWAWNTRRDPYDEGFFEFPQALARMGFLASVSNRAEFHHVNPHEAGHAGNGPFVETVRAVLDRHRWRAGSDEFLRRAGFDV